MNALGALFNKYGTDKDKNGYTPVYYALTRRFRSHLRHVLEIGIGTLTPGAPSSMAGYALEGYKPGGSLRAWRDWFPAARIYGIDIAEDTMLKGEDRIETYMVDSTSAAQVRKAFDIGYRYFDLVIDDGSHQPNDQLRTLESCYPLVKPGALYVIEDVVGHASSPLLRAWRPELERIIGHQDFFHAAGLIVIAKPDY